MLKPTPSPLPSPAADCPLEDCLRFLAGAWTPKILWHLKSGPRRFGDLKRDLGRVSAKVLTTRLRELEARGVVTRTVVPTSPPTVEYALTELGRKFEPVLEAIVVVGRELKRPEGAAHYQDCSPLKSEDGKREGFTFGFPVQESVLL